MFENQILFYPDGDGSGGSGGDDKGGSGDGGSQEDKPTGKAREADAATQDGGSGDGGSKDDTPLVKKLREEAAATRVKLREAQEELKKHEDAKKSDLEKAQGTVTELETKVTTLEVTARKALVRALGSEIGIVAEARADAASLLDWSKIEDPNDEEQVTKALKALVKEKPYLLGKVVGGADGGAGGRGGTTAESMNDRIRVAAGRR